VPINKIKKKDALDRFYTKPSISKMCLDVLDRYITPIDTLVEPSAGGGSFFNQINNPKIGYDVSPNATGIIDSDWFNIKCQEDWSLVEVLKLPNDCFELEGEDYHVPCVFQVWIKDWEGIDLRESKIPTTILDDFSFTQKGQGDYFMFGASPSKIINPSEVTPTNRGYWIKCSSDVRKKLTEVPWVNYSLSSVSGGVSWFTRKQIINIYGEYYYG